METQQTAVADSSPAVFEVPQDSTARQEWLQSGKLPAGTPAAESKEESTPSKNASASTSEEDAAETAAASAPANKQEKGKPNSAADRLNEILADLKKAGFTPAELKTFKREAKAAEVAEPGKESAKPSEKTANPQALEKPVKPTWEDKNPDGSKKWTSWEALTQPRTTITKR